MAGQVARPRLVAHQGVRRSAPSHPAPPCQTPHYPEAPTGLWPPLHQWYLVHLTPVQTIHNYSYKVIHHHYIMRQWSDQQCSPTWFHQRGRSTSLHLKTDHAWSYHSLVSQETRLVLLYNYFYLGNSYATNGKHFVLQHCMGSSVYSRENTD